jgi:hypothetical protein
VSQCTANTAAGARCRRSAERSSALCATHRATQERADRASFYGHLPGEDLRALAAAGVLQGVDAEIAVLRVLIRHSVTQGNVDDARKAIDSLGRLLRARHDLAPKEVDTTQEALNRVLDTLTDELAGGA